MRLQGPHQRALNSTITTSLTVSPAPDEDSLTLLASASCSSMKPPVSSCTRPRENVIVDDDAIVPRPPRPAFLPWRRVVEETAKRREKYE